MGGAKPVRRRERGQIVQAVEAEQRRGAGGLGQVAETVVPRTLQDGLERRAGVGAVAVQDVGPAGEAEGAEQGQAVQRVADVLRVDGLAGQVGVIVLDGVVGDRGIRHERRGGVAERGNGVVEGCDGRDRGRPLAGEGAGDGGFDRGGGEPRVAPGTAVDVHEVPGSHDRASAPGEGRDGRAGEPGGFRRPQLAWIKAAEDADNGGYLKSI